MKRIGTLAGYVGVALFFAVGVTQCIEVSESMPDNAIVYVDDELKVYHSPIHFTDDKIEPPSKLRRTTAVEAKSEKYKGDQTCRDREYFSRKRGSLLRATLSDLTGLAAQSRWNDDGSWNW